MTSRSLPPLLSPPHCPSLLLIQFYHASCPIRSWLPHLPRTKLFFVVYQFCSQSHPTITNPSSPPPPPLLTLSDYVYLVEASPHLLLLLDDQGNTPLERARNNDEGLDIVAFLEGKTEAAMGIRELIGEGATAEEFKERFAMWEDL